MSEIKKIYTKDWQQGYANVSIEMPLGYLQHILITFPK